MKLSSGQIASFQKKIFLWWEDHRRDLPWRHTRDPYKIVVSEVMLQQTQVSRVIPKYEEFLYFFPDVYTLTQASPAKVLRAWKGMGYNRRALYLQKAARQVVELYHGEFPNDEQQLHKLPGLGRYTARAVLVFAFKQELTMVDTNIRQIITHFFFDDKPQKESTIQGVAGKLVPKGKSWEWHQALMDYGALELNVSRVRYRVSRKKTIPFRESNRFYRGRIVDRLREGNMRQSVLLKECIGSYGKSREFYLKILYGLARDGLISRSRSGIISLPE